MNPPEPSPEPIPCIEPKSRGVSRAAGIMTAFAIPEKTALSDRPGVIPPRSEEHTSELQSLRHLVCRLLLEKNNIHTRSPILSRDGADDCEPTRLTTSA